MATWSKHLYKHMSKPMSTHMSNHMSNHMSQRMPVNKDTRGLVRPGGPMRHDPIAAEHSISIITLVRHF